MALVGLRGHPERSLTTGPSRPRAPDLDQVDRATSSPVLGTHEVPGCLPFRTWEIEAVTALAPRLYRPTLAVALGILSTATALHAQRVKCPPPGRLATHDPFQATHYYNAPGQQSGATPPIPQDLPAGYRGHATFVDLGADAPVDVHQIDFRLNDDGFLRFTWGTAPGVAGGIGLVGQTSHFEVYTTPDTWKGDWPTANGPTPKILVPPGAGSPWTLVATGTLTVQRHEEHSPAVLDMPFTVPVGTNGFAFVIGPVTDPVPHLSYQQPPYALHPSLLLYSNAPGAATSAGDQFVTITNQDVVNQAFVTAPIPVPKSAIFELHYRAPETAAYWAQKQAGCYDLPNSFYEYFAPGTFDLSGRSFGMTPNGAAYQVAATSASVVPPTSPPLTTAAGAPLGDDARTAPLSLGFAFPYPGGSTSSIVVTTNGNIFLDPANSGAQVTTFSAFGVAGFLRGQPQIAPLWSDLDPSSGGGVHLEVDLGAPVPVAYVTWYQVPTWLVPGSSNTVQVAMFADGRVEFRYGACDLPNVESIVGFTPGWSTHDPGTRDLASALPFTTGDGALPPDLVMDARPIVGSSPNLVLRDLPADTTGVVQLGVPIRGVDLFFAGMPGCVMSVVGLETMPFQASGPSAVVPLHVPNGHWLVGCGLQAQAIVMSPGSNAAGRTLSNALCLSVGN
jgi:hypothetical protein